MRIGSRFQTRTTEYARSRHQTGNILHGKPGTVMSAETPQRGNQSQGLNPMNKGALALLIHGGTENWSPERWKGRFDQLCRDRRVLLMPDVAFDPAEVHYAAVWKPRPGELAAFPNLRVIFNLGAGVDA